MKDSIKHQENGTKLVQCPTGINGPIDWHAFGCEVTIPNNITKIRVGLNAGWSNQQNAEAITYFDALYITKINDLANVVSNTPIATVYDTNLKTEVVFEGLESPTSMTFLGPDDFLVLEKNKGTVQRIVNGTMLPEPLLDVNVISNDERGMLGVAVTQKNVNSTTANNTYVFLYYTEAKSRASNGDLTQGNDTLGNRLYRYELAGNGSRLINPTLLLDLPALPGPAHNGGVIEVGPDNNIYVGIGDVSNICWSGCENPKQNSSSLDGSSGILRVTQEGHTVKGILGDKYPLDMYYAYGIRNIFGMDFDPVTGMLWDTENGEDYGDEINRIEPGFNSGYPKVQGRWIQNVSSQDIHTTIDGLLDFKGKGRYSDPEFEWSRTVGPTAIRFFPSNELGKQYENDIFVGDFNRGNVYHFDLNGSRSELALDGPLVDKFGETESEINQLRFARGFGGVTDLEVGPDGYLYVVSHIDGKIYRIVPADTPKDIRK